MAVISLHSDVPPGQAGADEAAGVAACPVHLLQGEGRQRLLGHLLQNGTLSDHWATKPRKGAKPKTMDPVLSPNAGKACSFAWSKLRLSGP